MASTMMKSFLAGAGLFSAALAITSISDSDMTNYLNSGGVQLAMIAQPMWFFGQAMDEPPCIPTFAVETDGSQTPSAPLCDYPDVGCSCRNPGVPISNPSPSFPIYFSFTKCNSSEIRIAYNVFYEKDGTNPDGILGHPFDWERVIVVWGLGSDGSWTQSQLLLSQHSGYGRLNWADIQNTFDDDTASQALGGPNGQTNLNHPKVYVAWSKHAHYDDRNTGWNDPLSQLTDNAFRSQDWWYFPVSGDYILADGSTQIGQEMNGFNWGDASSTPPSVASSLCSQ